MISGNDSARWKSKVDALIRLAEDQVGKPEGEVAKQKLKQILEKYPEAAQRHQPLGNFARREFTTADLRYMINKGISTEGQWHGRSLEEALMYMVADYRKRVEEYKNRPLPLAAGIVEIADSLPPGAK